MSPSESPPVRLTLEMIRSPEFWRQQCPALSINGRLASWDRDVGTLSSTTLDIYQQHMREEGYIQDRNLACERLAPALADAVRTCKRLGLSPVFVFVFDEAWECFYSLYPMISSMLGETYRVLPDFFAWHIDPQAGESGNIPHRDQGYKSLAEDRSPKSLTVWIPLTEATPQNSCIYVLPANRDPVYGTENEDKLQVDLTQIRALPAKPGDFIVWSQALLHWGSATTRFAAHPRISLGMDFRRADFPDFDGTEFNVVPFANLDFNERLKLIARNIHAFPQWAQLAQLLVS